ncbi:hypothetical protein KR059_004333, partial [Drosophila kikkawai]
QASEAYALGPTMECGIQDFYKDKVVFLTGATGFLGRGMRPVRFHFSPLGFIILLPLVIIEKLLRATDVKRIYAMVRPKRNQDIQARIQNWEKDPLFEVLLKSKPQALQRVFTIAGDCLEHDLGISVKDRQLLASEVQIFIHGAATVRFNEPLHIAITINTRATKLMLQLAKEMKHLQAFLHISSAFSNCPEFHIEERFYPELLNLNSEKILAMTEIVGAKMIDSISSVLVGSFPNTYTYSKALAEDVILREAGDLPLSVFRPAIIIASHKEPVSGWIDNLYGPITLIYGIGHGVIRLVGHSKKGTTSFVPVDYCANMALASIWQTGKRDIIRDPKEQPPIFTLAPSTSNLLSHTDFIKFGMSHRDELAVNKMIWYPFLNCVSKPWLYTLLAFFYHTLPGYMFDLILRLAGKKPRMVDLYRKIHINVTAIQHFLFNSWKFETKSADKLRSLMSIEDREMYNFDMEALDWKEYFKSALFGMRLYLGKEPPTKESFESGRRLLKLFKILHYGLMTVLLFISVFLLWSLLKFII